jgi:hypothetical protein
VRLDRAIPFIIGAFAVAAIAGQSSRLLANVFVALGAFCVFFATFPRPCRVVDAICPADGRVLVAGLVAAMRPRTANRSASFCR